MMFVLVLTYLNNLESASPKCHHIAALLTVSMAEGHISALGRWLPAPLCGQAELY